jgi:C-terminal processing protease CtpA/Prc
LFDAAFDDELKEAFDLFKEASAEIGDINYLILDLRYNGGGNVASCRYLSSIIAGNEAMNGSKPKVFMYSRYNDERMAEQGRDKSDYTTYKSDDFDGTAATAYNFPFKEIYVIGTDDTASSSEMLINGLRGIGEKVVLVGGTTNGKNVGMEVWNTQSSAIGAIDGNHYIFAPISFQAYNCKGESNFDNGFIPDIECQSEYDGYPPVDWGIYYIEALYQGKKVYYMPDYFSKAVDAILTKEFPQTASVKRVSPREISLNTSIRRMAAPERKQNIFRNNAWMVAEE